MDGTKQFANIYLDFLIIEMKNVIKLNFFAPFLCIFLCFFLSLSRLRVERSACKNLREQKPLLAEKAKKNIRVLGRSFLSSALCYARLDLNLGPSKLSIHRWTLTARWKKFFRSNFSDEKTHWALFELKGLSAVDTAGPQPGTFRSEEHRWTSSWDPRAQ
jgi:hypothetical protein